MERAVFLHNNEKLAHGRQEQVLRGQHIERATVRQMNCQRVKRTVLHEATNIFDVHTLFCENCAELVSWSFSAIRTRPTFLSPDAQAPEPENREPARTALALSRWVSL